jgi:RNA polymerase sigma-70 factor (ECF subfamily)
MKDGPPSDDEVIQRCQRGEVELFGVLVKRYQDRLYNLCFRLLGSAEDARDAAQETFIHAYEALGRFEVGRPFTPWLFRIATNACYGLLRKRWVTILSLDALEEPEAVSAAVGGELGEQEGDPEQSLVRAVRDEEIRQAVMSLPEPYRAVMLLRYMEDLSYEAIAEALAMPMGTVKTCLHRARQRLRRALTEEAT